MLAGKIWGQTELKLKTPILEIHKLTIKPQSFCSLHKHEFKWNAFTVLSGILVIEVKKNDYALTDETTLCEGDVMAVKPGEFHRFRTLNVGCVALEMYYPETLGEDIIRADVGGAA